MVYMFNVSTLELSISPALCGEEPFEVHAPKLKSAAKLPQREFLIYFC